MDKASAAKRRAIEKAQDEIRNLVTALHNEIYNLWMREGVAGEEALCELQREYADIARRALADGLEKSDWLGGIIEQHDTADSMAKLMDKRIV